MIIAHKRDIAAYVAVSSDLHEMRGAYEEGWEEVAAELVKEIQGADHPPYGQDWGAWLKANIEEFATEAVEIVM